MHIPGGGNNERITLNYAVLTVCYRAIINQKNNYASTSAFLHKLAHGAVEIRGVNERGPCPAPCVNGRWRRSAGVLSGPRSRSGVAGDQAHLPCAAQRLRPAGGPGRSGLWRGQSGIEDEEAREGSPSSRAARQRRSGVTMGVAPSGQHRMPRLCLTVSEPGLRHRFPSTTAGIRLPSKQGINVIPAVPG